MDRSIIQRELTNTIVINFNSTHHTNPMLMNKVRERASKTKLRVEKKK